jgi:hypothetical protein
MPAFRSEKSRIRAVFRHRFQKRKNVGRSWRGPALGGFAWRRWRMALISTVAWLTSGQPCVDRASCFCIKPGSGLAARCARQSAQKNPNARHRCEDDELQRASYCACCNSSTAMSLKNASRSTREPGPQFTCVRLAVQPPKIVCVGLSNFAYSSRNALKADASATSDS